VAYAQNWHTNLITGCYKLEFPLSPRPRFAHRSWYFEQRFIVDIWFDIFASCDDDAVAKRQDCAKRHVHVEYQRQCTDTSEHFGICPTQVVRGRTLFDQNCFVKCRSNTNDWLMHICFLLCL